MYTRITVVFFNLLIVAVVMPHNIHSWRPLIRPHESPLNVMTDIINDIGIKLLDCYIERHGNVAFSPTGLAFVLTALYEGSAGHTNRQLAHVLGLSHDRRVTRIGMRDVHRKLRSYLNADAFLGGLTLNRDNIVLRPEYEDILRFYGFDVADTMMANDTVNNSTNSTATLTTLPDTTETENRNVTDTNDSVVENTETTTGVTTTSILAEIRDTTINNMVNNLPTTVAPNSTVITASNGVNSNATIIDSINTTDSNQMNISEASSMASIVTATTPLAETSTTVSNSNNEMRLLSLLDTNSTSNTEISNSSVENDSKNINNQTEITENNTNVRRRRSFKHKRLLPLWFDDLNDWQDYAAPDDDYQGSLGEEIADLKFLVRGCDIITISTTTYVTILPFAYFPLLHAIGLEFPLDDPRYNMIIFVPTESVDTQTLTNVLSTKNLRYLRNSMRPTWIKATIPSFMLRGFITLTSYLQKLGIKDAFEPRAADLSPMSPDLGIYARDVHQSIGVNIRNHIKDNGNNNSSNISVNIEAFSAPGNVLGTREPIPFTADRPFLFFIVDVEMSVALIAGRIDDPLNSRII